MRYWWVNQNQTFRQEIDGGYLWSPKRNKNGHRNPFYEFMREVAPGDIVFSFCDTRIPAIGIVSGYCRESPKPEEFGAAGTNWSQIGWRVGVRWRRLTNAIRPKDHIVQLRSELATRYSPLTSDGNGLQSVYLTRVGAGLASALFRLIGNEVASVSDLGYEISRVERDTPAPERDIEEWERRVEVAIVTDEAIRETERLALVQARRGQGIFRDNVRTIERACRITKVERAEHLIASHVQPWRDSSNEQRLDGENGLLLTPTVDHLFDKGFISFEDSGQLIVSPVADQRSLKRMGIDAEGRSTWGHSPRVSADSSISIVKTYCAWRAAYPPSDSRVGMHSYLQLRPDFRSTLEVITGAFRAAAEKMQSTRSVRPGSLRENARNNCIPNS